MTTIEITATAPPHHRTSPQWLIVHYHRADGDYADWALHAWGDVAPGEETTYPAGTPFAGEDSYGRFAWVRLAPEAREVGFLVVHRYGAKDVDLDRWVDLRQTSEIWLRANDRRVALEPPAPAPAPDPGFAVIHYRRPDGDYSGWGLHCWEGVERTDKTRWSTPKPPTRFDEYGAVFQVPVRPDAVGLRFVVHRGDDKDLPDDQRLDLTTCREVWMLAGVAAPVRPDLGTLGPELDPARSLAVFLDRGTVALPEWFAARAATFTLVASADGKLRRDGTDLTGEDDELALVPRPGGLFQAQSRRFPHLRAYRAFAVRELGDAVLGDLLRGQLLVAGRDAAGRVTALTGVQLAGVLDDLYAEAADAELGPLPADEDRPQLAVWAPTARHVRLELFREPGEEPRLVPMDRDPVTGVWSVTAKRKWLGRYYRFQVEVWHPAAQRVVTTSVTDPYSVSLATDSTHSQLVDLADPALCPPGWDTLVKPPAVAPARMQIAEVSVRDFSIFDSSVPAAERGTFLAFTHPGSDGMRHLRSLADAGLTHVHLLPVNDFATVPDRRADQAQPACDLASFPPDSPEQQRAVMAVADEDGYNWGYDPWHWTTPEGAYATDPAGSARILQMRSMVAALNAAGLRVVLDVVYNHTMGDGLDRDSVLDRIVPGYYHRLLADGSTAESTCCPNTATEHMMMSKLVIDSVVTWAREYRIDGFRFDLMGHHPRANILEARIALDRLGEHGRDICIYGEGWNFGEVAYDARFAQATQVNMAGTGIGTFNDRLRDAARGGGSFGDDPGVQGFATGLGSRTPLWLHDRIKVGLTGALSTYRFVTHTGAEQSGAQIDYNGSPSGYAHSPGETVNYVDAHDNEILYDAMAFKLPIGTPPLDRARMQVLALALVVLSQGAGFVALGSERLRSKSLDRNSFNSGDWFNQIRWDPALGNGFGLGLPPFADNGDKWEYARPLLAEPSLVAPPDAITLTAERYRELLRIRSSSPVFGLPTTEEVQRRVTFPLGGPHETPGVIVMCLDGTGLDPRWRSIVVVFNATEEGTRQRVPEADLRPHPELVESADPVLREAGAEPDQEGVSVLEVPARSVAVYVSDLA
ncbi:pullulanase-type alpha-1,6-glucosidase [Actinoplanes aureus]|uniref:alpha-amylase n=1 Tax=Actinoplanes aureus TaxID=2792083 RepID=A0A931FXJ3_9ACTN|nr:pullulanase-type alpha-1,6-glucosidase [Actinoplanes aureus]MBG0563623.1 pullulanase-type alpha-1,6-glucosidase [Actinoplanes aureus]